MSLRAKVVAPLFVVASICSALISYGVLSSLSESITTAILHHLTNASFIESTHAGSRVPGGGFPNPSVVVLEFDSSGRRAQRHASAASAIMPEVTSTADIAPPSSFLDNGYVGLIGDAEADLDGSVIAVLVDTAPYRSLYSGVRDRVVTLSLACIALVTFAGGLIAAAMSRRVNVLRGHVKNFESIDARSPSERSDDEFGRLEADIIAARTRVQESRREISRLQVVRSQFLANVSHEVRTPLFSLKGFLETLLDGGIDDPAVNRTFLEKALHHSQRIDNLLRDLIDIARIESGEMKMSFRYFRISGLLEQVREDHAGLALHQQQEFKVAGTADADLEVIGDKERLRLAISNLVENALKYSPPGSTVTVSAEPEPTEVVIAVEDNGPGIAPEHAARIFERFYRVEPDRSREMGGTGLGLAIAKHIVEAHGSEVIVSSQTGKGSAFSFRIRR